MVTEQIARRLLISGSVQGVGYRFFAQDVAARLGISPNNLTFHFDKLREAGLITVRREGRSMIYSAHYDAMNALLGYLTENCCQGAAANCAAPACNQITGTKRVRERA